MNLRLQRPLGLALALMFLANCSGKASGGDGGNTITLTPTAPTAKSNAPTSYQGVWAAKVPAQVSSNATSCATQIQLHQDKGVFEIDALKFNCDDGAAIAMTDAKSFTLQQPSNAAVLAYDLVLNGAVVGWLNKDNSAFDVTLTGDQNTKILFNANLAGDTLTIDSYRMTQNDVEFFSIENANLTRAAGVR